MARKQIDSMRSAPVSDDELSQAKKYLTGSFPLRLDSNAEIAGLLAQIEFYGLGHDYIDQYAEHINAVTTADVQRVAREYLHPDKLILVVVGQAAEVGITPTTTSPTPSGSP